MLHDLSGVPVDDVARAVDRARHKVRGTPTVLGPEFARHRQVAEAYPAAAARGGDLGALLDVPGPDVVRRADPAALPPWAATELRGARAAARARP